MTRNVNDSLLGSYGEFLEISSIFDPRRKLFRALILIGCCFLTFGVYFCYDIPGALSANLLDPYYNINTFEFSIFYSIYSLPNSILPFFGGLIIDKYLGVKFGAIFFVSLVLLGQIVWASTSFFHTRSAAYYVSILGRFIFGTGSESLTVAQSTYCANYFSGKELATAFGIILAFSRIGTALNYLTVPEIAANPNLGIGAALWVGVIACIISFVAAHYLAILSTKSEKIITTPQSSGGAVVRFRDILHFKYSIWYLIIICVLFYISLFVFLQFGSTFLQSNYGVTPEIGGFLIAIPSLVVAILAPLFGIIIDRFGYPLYALCAACFLNAIALLSLLIFEEWIYPFIPMILIGTAYALVAASLWPCIPCLVQSSELATCYGLFFSAQNFGLFFAPMILGLLIEDGTYLSMMISLFGCSLMAGIVCISLIVCDVIDGKLLNISAKLKLLRMENEIHASTLVTAETLVS